MATVELRDVTKWFGANLIVDGLDLTIPDGSFTVLLGPSGCGKTTTLNMISGLEEVTSGTITFDGEAVQHVAPHRRDVAMVFQSYALYPNRTVRENIAFALKMRRIPAAEIRERVSQAAEMLGIGQLLNRRPRQLSGGQQQRVALARAIVRRPRVFLLDEPLSNLDAKLRADMRISLRELQRELNGTFVYVTHDQGEAMSMADHVVVMNGGIIQQYAAPMDLYREPANEFVASFVGTPSMNMIRGQLSVGGQFRAADWTAELGSIGASAGEVVLGVRPEDVILAADATGTGTVRIVERLGTEAIVAVAESCGDIVARAAPDIELSPGERVGVSVRPAKVHMFAQDTGLRIGPLAPAGRPA
ncbi:MAG TPA: ABC transporter ATP-binding protein [Streptosporangiaceae bacterium]|nr:ABC transporter ATP-binding protein [Streptosporangiaceae bacterium]